MPRLVPTLLLLSLAVALPTPALGQEDCEDDEPCEPETLDFCPPWETGVIVTPEEDEAPIEACLPVPSPATFRACPQGMQGYIVTVAGRTHVACFWVDPLP